MNQLSSKENPVLDTFPKLLAANAARFPDETALREKQYGIWKSQSWSQYNSNVRSIAQGLQVLGIKPGEIVGIIGDNRPDWVAAEIAVHACQGVSLGLYRDLMEQELAYLVNYAETRIVFVEDEEQVDKFLNLEEECSCVEHIIYEDPRGVRKYDDPRLISLESLREQGEAQHKQEPASYESLVSAGNGETLAILCTTSGTTSHPKLVMLNARSVIEHCNDYLRVDPKDETDEYVSTLPLPWIMEQVYAVGMSLISRMTVNFVEESATMLSDLREIGPTFVLFPPRLWEELVATVRARMMDASWVKRTLHDHFLSKGLSGFDSNQPSALAEWGLFKALKDRLGLTNVRSAATGGAALGPDTFKFFLAMGVPLRQLYGQTELLGAYTIHSRDDVDFDTVGVPFCDAIKVRIEQPDAKGIGEIVTRHDNMFLGYYKDEVASQEDMREGWMHTGDAGYYNSAGHLVVIDRISDLATMNSGLRYSPQFIENKLKFCPYIGEAVVLGADRDYLTAMICIRYPILSKWAEKQRISFTTYTDLSSRPEAYELISEEIKRINETLPEAQRLRRFVLLYKELDADDGELTRTRKVRRKVVNQKYEDIIDAIYTDRQAIEVDTMITFQDGTQQRIQTSIVVHVLDDNKLADAREALS
ncbi:AMP-binding protein [Granulosicoccus antarcticus]|uniref:Long-chain-fatty-acid--CoA ligase FadD15 n=1 Tax=Granulosicoccus antarcticus IMCC3135 TaxID=1192854 RepID=A0A2Z2NSF0_9GAMM|nr:AMP-binding protein [Granulosicoccus antarcticus]ASJ74476.1 Long-chain-fatty-acid--CoA ligase FadD15 [Granulosicoccus antarcticus IMCC3135]